MIKRPTVDADLARLLDIGENTGTYLIANYEPKPTAALVDVERAPEGARSFVSRRVVAVSPRERRRIRRRRG